MFIVIVKEQLSNYLYNLKRKPAEIDARCDGLVSYPEGKLE